MKNILSIALAVSTLLSLSLPAAQAGLLTGAFKGTSKGAKETVGGTGKGAKETVGGTSKGIKSAGGGIAKGIKSTFGGIGKAIKFII